MERETLKFEPNDLGKYYRLEIEERYHKFFSEILSDFGRYVWLYKHKDIFIDLCAHMSF